MTSPLSCLKLTPIPPKNQPEHFSSESALERVFKRTLQFPVKSLWSWNDRSKEGSKVFDYSSLTLWIQESPSKEKSERELFFNMLEKAHEIGQSHLLIKDYPYLSKLPCLLPLFLTSLEINNCQEIKSLPADLKNQKNLSKLSLRDCPNFSIIPDEIRHLQNLRYLTLSLLHSLESLNPNICNLENLESLHVLQCSKIQKLPKEISKLKNLQILSFHQCTDIEAIPPGIGDLKNLHYLNLSATKLKYLPDSIGNLNRLQTLILSRCNEIETLPNSLTNCTNLTQILANHCKSLKTIPKEIGMLGRACHICFQNSPIAFSSVLALEKANRFLRIHTSHLGPRISISSSTIPFGINPLDQRLKFLIQAFQSYGLQDQKLMLSIDFFRHEIPELHQKILEKFLREAQQTSEFLNLQTRGSFLQTIFQILQEASQNPSFYHEIFHPLALAALSSCEDQLLIGINRMFLELEIHQTIEEKNIERIFDFLFGFRNLQLLYEEVKILAETSQITDFVETFLSLQILLQKKLKLPFQTSTMKYSYEHFFQASKFAKAIEAKILEKTSPLENQIQWLCNEPEKSYQIDGRVQAVGDLSPENPFAIDLANLWVKALETLDPSLYADIEIQDEDLMDSQKLQEYRIKRQKRAIQRTETVLLTQILTYH